MTAKPGLPRTNSGYRPTANPSLRSFRAAADLVQSNCNREPALDAGHVPGEREHANALGDKGFGTIAMFAFDVQSAGP